MPPARKPKAAPTAPEPLNTYGMPRAEGATQLDYDRIAFARKMDVGSGCPTRINLFKRISDKLLPGHFEWHDWTYRIVENLCIHETVGVPGCSGCVSGDTKILNPITGEEPTFQELCENGIAPMVMTMDGPTQAEVPYLKGVADLFEITLENGVRFEATSEHRVFASFSNANRYIHVSDLRCGQHLLSYAPSPPESTSGLSLSNQLSNAQSSLKKAANYQERCFPSLRHGDAQPPLEEDTCRSFSPSLNDAPTRNHWNCNEDAQASRFSRIHAQEFDPLSSYDFWNLRNSSGMGEPRLGNPRTASPVFPLCRLPYQSHLEMPFQRPFAKPVQDFSDNELIAFSSYQYRVSRSMVVSIRKTRKANFYDISVPGPQHYFAQGAIHHNSAKTYNIHAFAAIWWLCDPVNSSVTVVSTTREMLKARGWTEITRAFASIPGTVKPGHLVNSKLLWQAKPDDMRHAIRGIAVEQGPIHTVADGIKGIHTRRQMVIIDEATAVPAAIYEACANLYSYPQEFIIVTIGNPLNRLDQFGRFCEPENGWTSVTVETGEWEGKPQGDMGGRVPYIVTMDAEKSPNIVEGRIVSRHLPTKQKVEAAKNASGGGMTPLYWQNFRGFWPPEGLTKTVFSQSALEKSDAFGRHKFTGRNFTIIGAFDPARTGDRPALRFAKLGEIEGGKWGIEWMPPKVIPINATSTNPIFFQLCEAVMREAAKIEYQGATYWCAAENFAIDASGSGSGCADIFQRMWSPRVLRIEFGGKPSEDSASFEDARKACDIYDTKTTEMHFRTRDAVNSGQLKGVDRETATELITREFDDSKAKIKLQPKDEYKLKYKISPDFGDCGVMTLEVARIRGFRLAAMLKTAEEVVKTSDFSRAAQEVYSEKDSFTTEEEAWDEEPVEAL